MAFEGAMCAPCACVLPFSRDWYFVTFEELRLAEPLLRALNEEGYTTPTPIQAQAIPQVMSGKDILGIAQTGTGKTAAFAVPILHKLLSAPQAAAPAPEAQPAQGQPRHTGVLTRGVPRPFAPKPPSRKIKALILAPTRELAVQIGESFRNYGRHSRMRYTVIFGGVGQHPQVADLRAGVDIVVATPGRLLDLMEQGHVHLQNVETFVLDEADHMLDMGFVPDVRRIASELPASPVRQTLMFSATMPFEIRSLANSLLTNPVKVEVSPVSSTVERIDQSVFFVDRRNKPALMIHLLETTPYTRALVFSRTKHGADKIVRVLRMANIDAEAIHGNKSQGQRQRTLANFKNGRTSVLIASDIAARGIDIDDISHVFNYDLPEVPETYVHRIGRTGRAGSSGIAISFCDYDERGLLKAIERTSKAKIALREDHPKYGAPIHMPRVEDVEHEEYDNGPRQGGRQGGRGGFNNGPRQGGFNNNGPRQGGFNNNAPRQGGFNDNAPRQGGFNDAPRPQGGGEGAPRQGQYNGGGERRGFGNGRPQGQPNVAPQGVALSTTQGHHQHQPRLDSNPAQPHRTNPSSTHSAPKPAGGQGHQGGHQVNQGQQAQGHQGGGGRPQGGGFRGQGQGGGGYGPRQQGGNNGPGGGPKKSFNFRSKKPKR